MLRDDQAAASVPAVSAVASATQPAARRSARVLPSWWPLAALIVLASILRFATLGQQSFWYDEAFTPVHVLHSGLGATMRAVAHTENTPPLWYLIAWLDVRVLGDGAFALRLPSALAGVLTVPVVWAIGEQLAGRPTDYRPAIGRRVALIGAAIVAVNPLLVWYSQEARAYGLFVLFSALAMLCFVRVVREPTRGRVAAFALSGSLALLTHYFAVFLLLGMVLWLLRERALRRAALPAIGALALVGLALLPLISAQGGHGTQWIGRWALSSRLQAIPQYYLTGYSGSSLGRGVELLVALPILAGIGLGAWRLLGGAALRVPAPATAQAPAPADGAGDAREDSGPAAEPDARLREGALIALLITVCGVLLPIVLAVFGADYLAPRNLVGAMIPLTVLLAILLAAADTGGLVRGAALGARAPVGLALAATIVAAFLLLTVDVDLSPRLQRGNWRGLARVLTKGTRPRAITTGQLGAAPLEYYIPPLRNLARGASVTVREIDETGYAPLRPSAGRPPAPGFHLLDRRDVNGLIVYRFVSPVPRIVSESALRRHVITLAHPEVLVSAAASGAASAAPSGAVHAVADVPVHHALTGANAGPRHAQTSSSDENI
jgi:4-amino-4-deoxy-L-arabinose transferase-like glycosyltransferase